MNAGRQAGFTLLGLLLIVAAMGAGLAAYGTIYSHAAQREKEAELLFRGSQYRLAIESYYRKSGTYPQTLEELLADHRFPTPARHLRRPYLDPMTGAADWGLMEAPEGGGIMGVFSKSDAPPIKRGNFPIEYLHFGDAKTYQDWQFFHSPSGATSAP